MSCGVNGCGENVLVFMHVNFTLRFCINEN